MIEFALADDVPRLERFVLPVGIAVEGEVVAGGFLAPEQDALVSDRLLEGAQFGGLLCTGGQAGQGQKPDAGEIQ